MVQVHLGPPSRIPLLLGPTLEPGRSDEAVDRLNTLLGYSPNGNPAHVSRFAAGRFAAISDSAVSSGASALEEDEKQHWIPAGLAYSQPGRQEGDRGPVTTSPSMRVSG